MTTTFSSYQRREQDDYPTPVEAVDVLFTKANPYRITRDAWDPCCGKGENILRAVRAHGIRATGSDIIHGDDFIAKKFGPTKWDIVTNPPFGTQGRLALKFIEHSLARTERYSRKVMMLLPIDFDSGSTRRHVFGECPRFAHKIVLLNRVRIFNGQSGTTNHAWFIWAGLPIWNDWPTLSYARIEYAEPPPKRN